MRGPDRRKGDFLFAILTSAILASILAQACSHTDYAIRCTFGTEATSRLGLDYILDAIKNVRMAE